MQIYNIHVSVCNSTCARNTVEHVVCMFYVRLLKGTRGVGRGVGSLTSVFCYPYALLGVEWGGLCCINYPCGGFIQ